VGYIRVPTFGTDLVAQFDAALDRLMDAPGLVLDVRGNGGGNSAFGDQMAGRLLGQPFVYGRDNYAGRLPTRAWRRWFAFAVSPREPVYTGPVVVIVETANASSAEQFLISLVDSDRIRTVGRRTGGASANPVRFRLPGDYDARFSTADFHRNDGTSIEGVGIIPDLEVAWTLEDFRQGRDPDLAAAERLLLEELSRQN
jgi:carboxyl-terminal processing protease